MNDIKHNESIHINDDCFLEFCKGNKISFNLKDMCVEVFPPHYKKPSNECEESYRRGFDQGSKAERFFSMLKGK